MSDSSKDESEVQISLSARKRRSCTRSRITSDSDSEERKEVKEHSESSLAVETKGNDDGCDDVHGHSHLNPKTPRTSERLRRKRTRSFTFPSRGKRLESVSGGRKMTSSQTKINSLRPRKLVNNFLKERTTYVNRDEVVDSDDSGMSDFINDDVNSNDSAESMSENNNSEASYKDYGTSDTNSPGNERIQGSCSEGNHNRKQSSDSSLSSTKNKSTSSDEGMKKRVKRRKRKKVIQSSDSDEGTNSAINQKQEKQSFALVENNGASDNEGSDSSENSELKEENAPLRPKSRRLKSIIQQRKQKHHEKFDILLKKRQAAKMDPKERLARNQAAGSEKSDTFSESENDPIKEAEAIFLCTSELEEDDDDRDFIDDEEQSCDDGLNSEAVSEFLKLLDTFTANPKNGGGSSVNRRSRVMGHSHYKRRLQWRRKKAERKVSQWRRIKMEAESEDNEDAKEGTEIRRRYSPVHIAILEDDFGSVKELIKEDPDCVYELDYRKRTALHLAALEGRFHLVELLLNHGADRTALDCYHLPAISYAADGHPDCLRLLLDHANIKSICKRMRRNPQGMNLLHFAIGENREVLECEKRAKCLELLFSQDKVACSKLLEEGDARGFSPLVAAIYAGQHKCVEVLLKMGANAFEYKTDDGGNMLHFAVECASHFKDSQELMNDTSVSLREVLKALNLVIDDADNHGFTPLMYACESGNPQCVQALLENGASVNFSDSHGTSSLHLAAMSGDTECIQLLLNFGHKVDCIDRYGWPPLLYANFKAHESCVLALMKPKPEQVFILGDLLKKARNNLEKERAVKVVKNVLVSLANHDAYYTVFNDFIRQNPEMLDENNYGLLQHTWRAILDFDNKHRWFRRQLSQIRVTSSSLSCDTIHLEIDRENVLGSAINQMGRTLGHALRSRSLSVTFKNEPGICTGPKREFFACFCKDIIDPKRGLFVAADDSQYSPTPNAYFAKYAKLESPADSGVNSEYHSHVSEKVKHEQASNGLTEETTELPSVAQGTDGNLTSPVMSTELTDEELTTESQTEDHSSILGTDDNGRGITECESTDANEDLLYSESVNGDTEQTDVSRMSLEEECTVLNQHSRVCNGGNRQNVSQTSNAVTWISCMDDSKGDKSIISLSLRSKLKQLRFIGRMIGFAVYQNLLLNLQLSKPFVKQILGIPLSHPDDLSSFDYELHKNAVVWVRENSVDQLELPFSVDAINPWNSKLVTIELSNDVDRKLTDNNKGEYAKLVSQLKLEMLVKDEVAEFAGGLNEVIPRELLSLFTADEFSLLIGGVAKIDVNDWKSNTKYDGWSSTDDEISWFWGVVSQLKEEEKALLLKFSTGSPCVPIGGFASLTGLGGATKFTVLKIDGVNKIPMASTCFNMLKLSRYSSEKQLKDKLLIAIRHGAEGFSFS